MASLALFAVELVCNSSEDRVSNIRGTSLETGVTIDFCRIVFLGGGGATKNVPESSPKIDKLKSNAMTLIYFICLLQKTLIPFHQNNECLWNYIIPE